MYYVYVLQSKKNKNKLYIGNTNNLERRLAEHNSGDGYFTKTYKPFKIVYYEAFLDKHDAVNREIKLKHHGSVIGHLKRRIQKSLNN
ncbi:GIY-YIG nuclease family protein [Candidatus Omnitrophota bacterium]